MIDRTPSQPLRGRAARADGASSAAGRRRSTMVSCLHGGFAPSSGRYATSGPAAASRLPPKTTRVDASLRLSSTPPFSTHFFRSATKMVGASRAGVILGGSRQVAAGGLCPPPYNRSRRAFGLLDAIIWRLPPTLARGARGSGLDARPPPSAVPNCTPRQAGAQSKPARWPAPGAPALIRTVPGGAQCAPAVG
jgi:hypothetical protein